MQLRKRQLIFAEIKQAGPDTERNYNLRGEN